MCSVLFVLGYLPKSSLAQKSCFANFSLGTFLQIGLGGPLTPETLEQLGPGKSRNSGQNVRF